MYYCQECSLAVIVIDNEPIKACICDAPIIGEMSAVAEGIGGVK